MEIQELVEKVNSEWEGIFIQEEDNIRNMFLKLRHTISIFVYN